MEHTVTIYQSASTLRVVRGEHKAHDGSKSQRIAVYPNAQAAYAVEEGADVRAAILRIDPTATGGKVGPIKRVALFRAPELKQRATVIGGRCVECGADIETDEQHKRGCSLASRTITE